MIRPFFRYLINQSINQITLITECHAKVLFSFFLFFFYFSFRLTIALPSFYLIFFHWVFCCCFFLPALIDGARRRMCRASEASAGIEMAPSMQSRRRVPLAGITNLPPPPPNFLFDLNSPSRHRFHRIDLETGGGRGRGRGCGAKCCTTAFVLFVCFFCFSTKTFFLVLRKEFPRPDELNRVEEQLVN